MQVFAAPRYAAPAEKRYLVNDTTVEKLGELLNHNPNGLLLFRDELSVNVDVIMAYGDEAIVAARKATTSMPGSVTRLSALSFASTAS